jgi:hypothetical protein
MKSRRNQWPDATFPNPEEARHKVSEMLAEMREKCHRGMPEYEITVVS